MLYREASSEQEGDEGARSQRPLSVPGSGARGQVSARCGCSQAPVPARDRVPAHRGAGALANRVVAPVSRAEWESPRCDSGEQAPVSCQLRHGDRQVGSDQLPGWRTSQGAVILEDGGCRSPGHMLAIYSAHCRAPGSARPAAAARRGHTRGSPESRPASLDGLPRALCGPSSLALGRRGRPADVAQSREPRSRDPEGGGAADHPRQHPVLGSSVTGGRGTSVSRQQGRQVAAPPPQGRGERLFGQLEQGCRTHCHWGPVSLTLPAESRL